MSKQEQYVKDNCSNCKNKDTNLCHITINEREETQCVYKDE